MEGEGEVKGRSSVAVCEQVLQQGKNHEVRLGNKVGKVSGY